MRIVRLSSLSSLLSARIQRESSKQLEIIIYHHEQLQLAAALVSGTGLQSRAVVAALKKLE